MHALQTRARLGVALATAAVALLGVFAVGCGYALVGQASSLPPDIATIFIAPLDNETNRAQVEQFLTDSITDEMLTRRRYTVVRSSGEADAQLLGAITGFRVTPITFDDEGLASEYEITITADVRFERVESEEVIWGNDNYLFRETYEVDPSEASFFDRENVAIQESTIRFAETIITDLLEGF
jgi:hypothetical protein